MSFRTALAFFLALAVFRTVSAQNAPPSQPANSNDDRIDEIDNSENKARIQILITRYTAIIQDKDSAPDKKADAFVGRATILIEELGEVDKSIADFTSAIEMTDAPPRTRAMALRGRAMIFGMHQKNYPSAIKDLTQALQLGQSGPEFTMEMTLYRGDCYANDGNLPDAIADFTAAINMTGFYAQNNRDNVLLHRARALAKQKEFEKATADCQAIFNDRDAAPTNSAQQQAAILLKTFPEPHARATSQP